MRISTNQIFNQNLAAMLDQQSKLAETQLQISSGKRILNPSDDPAGSVNLLNLDREFSLINQYQENADRAINKLESEESALASAADLLQRIRELAVQGLNDTNTASDRQAIASEIQQLNQQLFSLANTRDSNGDYLFSGFASGIQPYETIYGAYQGDEGQRHLKVGEGALVATNDPGDEVFESPLVSTLVNDTLGVGSTASLNITDNSNTEDTFSALTLTFNAGQYTVSDTDGNVAVFDYNDGERVRLSDLNPAFPTLEIELSGTPLNGDQFTITREPALAPQSVFQTIENFVTALSNNDVGANDSPNNGDFLTNISAALTNIIDVRAEVGGRLNAIDKQKEINDTLAFALEKNISSIRDLDYAEAISELSRQTLGLQAAQQSFVKVQNLSLFNFL